MADLSEPEKHILSNLAREVRSLRVAAGLSQLHLAQRAGTSRSVIARLEAGERPPTISTLAAISAALGVGLNIRLQKADELRSVQATSTYKEGPRFRVLVADSQRLFAQSLATALAQFPEFEVSYVKPKTPLTTGLEAAELVVRYKPDVALLDYWLSEMKGGTLVKAVLSWAPKTKVVVLSWFHGPRELEAAVKAGAVGFLPKTLSVEDIADAVRAVQAGRNLLPPERVQQLVKMIARQDQQSKQSWERVSGLTPREVDVLRMVASGEGMKEIAKAMEISQGTLRIHLNKIMAKTGAASRMEAIAMAREAGLIS